MTEPVPPISENDFNRLMKVNPFDEEKRTVCDTFKVLVDLPVLRRTENVAVLEPLLEISTRDTQGALLIPLTLRNLKVLCDHPQQAADNSPVFRLFDDTVLDQCNDWPDRISVSFISECVAEETRGEDYDTQRKLLRERGFRVASLRHCILRNVAPLLMTGTCADSERTFARNPDLIDDGNDVYHTATGGLGPCGGLVARYDYDHGYKYMAVVPCLPAEDLSSDGG